jgi:hypothetical protein
MVALASLPGQTPSTRLVAPDPEEALRLIASRDDELGKDPAVGLLAFGATTASAAVVCNDEGDCWRTKERYTYPPDAGVRIYSDDWRWGPNDKYRWREHEGRGYWGPKGAWIEF